jgi:hypothetical protein
MVSPAVIDISGSLSSFDHKPADSRSPEFDFLLLRKQRCKDSGQSAQQTVRLNGRRLFGAADRQADSPHGLERLHTKPGWAVLVARQDLKSFFGGFEGPGRSPAWTGKVSTEAWMGQMESPFEVEALPGSREGTGKQPV